MNRSTFRCLALPAAFLMLVLARTAQAQLIVCYPKNATIRSAFENTVIVGYASTEDADNKQRPTSPNVTLVRGSYIPSGLHIRNSSRVTVKGGRLGSWDIGSGVLVAHDSSAVLVTGGSMEVLEAEDNSVVTIHGGQFHHEVSASDRSNVTISGGWTASVVPLRQSTLTITGGAVGGRPSFVDQDAQMWMLHNFRRNFKIRDFKIKVVSNSKRTAQTAAVPTQNPAVQTAAIPPTPPPAPPAPCLIVLENSIVNLHGGSINGSLKVSDSGTLNVYGTDLSKTLVDANAGEGYSLYKLSGILSDGFSLDGKLVYIKNDSAKVNFINTAVSSSR